MNNSLRLRKEREHSLFSSFRAKHIHPFKCSSNGNFVHQCLPGKPILSFGFDVVTFLSPHRVNWLDLNCGRHGEQGEAIHAQLTKLTTALHSQ